MQLSETAQEILEHIEVAQERYGDFTSTHEALGVAVVEFDELKAAIQANKLESVRDEAIDLAAVLIRLADQCRNSERMKARSMK